MNQWQSYVDLVECILQNAKDLAAGAYLLLKNPRTRVFGQFLMYQSVEECSKVQIIIDLYPDRLTKKNLRCEGFYDHNLKLETLIRAARVESGRDQSKVKDSEIARTLIKHLREASIYVDFIGKPVPPKAISGANIERLASLTLSCIKSAEQKIRDFKKRIGSD